MALARGDDVSLTLRILEAALAQGATITAAESCTSGMVAAALTDPAGASAVFERGFVTYSNIAKSEMLGVSPDTLATHGAVSEEVAGEMARGALQSAKATYAVAISGIAGPGGSDFKPEGRVCFALGTATKITTETIEFGSMGRAGVRIAARDHALRLLLAALETA